ncbi:flagellar biosynthesis protein FlhA [Phycisphaerales bacterium AB-hyl4]|uniref:Flagellar biosynthesis protein FlhA n=1 Tax=Natronomicrosphaera hydrolytica TaxID=3242702 RepID=A0ABV4U4Z0_9BACT
MAKQPANPMNIAGAAAFVQRHQSLIVPVLFIAMLAVIVVPLPTIALDLLITANLALAALILMTTLFVRSPLDFSGFPSLLLGTAMFRLVLNIASTRLILSMAADTPEEATAVAGRVIQAFAEFVTGGGVGAGPTAVVVGVILFVILIIVQFVVITKGATRISEVAARFQLDGMPGKQMAIDADLNAGLIDEKQAKSRRKQITDESDFYGRMDGAAKFVRGDAIAGIIITVINIVAGFTIGIAIKGWSFGDSLQIFTLLTIGDGLVSQLPALVISLSAGLIVTRSSSDQDMGTELTQQLTSRHAALGITAGFLVLMAFTGMPMLPMLLAAGSVGGLGFMLHRAGQRQQVADTEAEHAKTQRPEKPPVEQSLHVDTLELEVGYGLVRLVDASQGGDLLERIDMIRRQLAGELGFVMPPVRIRDNMQLTPSDYHIKLRGNSIANGQVYPGQFLAMDSGLASEPLPGTRTREPAFGLDATWIESGQKQRAEALNYTVVDATSVLATHLTETVKGHAHELLSREETNNLITQLREKAPKLVDEVLGPAAAGANDATPTVKSAELQKVLQNLLRERVPVRDLETILETLGDWAPRTKDLEVLTEYVRNALRRTICNQYVVTESNHDAQTGLDDGVPVTKLYCVSLDPALEDRINGYIERSTEGTSMTMPPAVANRITTAMIQELQRLLQGGHNPVVLASPQVRASVRRLIEPHLPNAAVLGYNEVSKGVEVESLGLVQVSNERREEMAGSV